MSSIRRAGKVISGLLMIIGSILFIMFPKDGAIYVVLCIDIALLLYGMRMIIYYITLARFMVGGIMTLYKSIIVIDFGLFVFYLYEIPYRLVMFYLAGVMAFHGVTVILSAMESRRLEVPFWRGKLAYGVINILLVIVSVLMMDSMKTVAYIFSISLIHSAIYNIVSAFRKSAVIYIE